MGGENSRRISTKKAARATRQSARPWTKSESGSENMITETKSSTTALSPFQSAEAAAAIGTIDSSPRSNGFRKWIPPRKTKLRDVVRVIHG